MDSKIIDMIISSHDNIEFYENIKKLDFIVKNFKYVAMLSAGYESILHNYIYLSVYIIGEY